MDKRNLIIASKKIARQNKEKEKKQAAQLVIANREIIFRNREKQKCIDKLSIANNTIDLERKKCHDELSIAKKENAWENSENKKLAAELDTANKEIAIQNKEIRLTEEQLEFNNHNLHALINSTYDLMWSVDINFRLITCNKAFDDLMVLMSGAVIRKGTTILDISFPKEQLAKYKVFYQRAFNGETFIECDYRDTPGDTWSEISFYPIRKAGMVVGTACYSRDITARKKAELSLLQRNEDLEEFAQMVSHALRGPVASILGATAMFSEPTLSTGDRAVLADGIKESAIRLDAVTGDLTGILQRKRR